MAGVCPKCGNPMSMDICSVCGLSSDLCVCATIERAEQRITIFTETRKFNKPITIIEGITENAKDITKQLKSRLACGGTRKDNHIELQGNHKIRAKEILIKLGYNESQIQVS